MWIRKQGAFEGIVPLDTFMAAQEIMTERSRRIGSTHEMTDENVTAALQ
jgi:hypothetical protein